MVGFLTHRFSSKNSTNDCPIISENYIAKPLNCTVRSSAGGYSVHLVQDGYVGIVTLKNTSEWSKKYG